MQTDTHRIPVLLYKIDLYLNSVGFIFSWKHANKEEKAEILQKL